MDIDENLQLIDDLLENHSENEETESALQTAADALAFCKSLFDVFKENNFVAPDQDFDLAFMENLIDSLVGELSAAVLYLKGLPPERQVTQSLRVISEKLGNHNKSLLSEEGAVPHVVQMGFSRLADRVSLTNIGQ